MFKKNSPSQLSSKKSIKNTTNTTSPNLDIDKYGFTAIGAIYIGSDFIEQWKEKGLVINEDTLFQIGEQFYHKYIDYIHQHSDFNGPVIVSTNKYLAVIKYQEVSKPFIEGYALEMSMLENKDIIKSFMNGELFYMSPIDT